MFLKFGRGDSLDVGVEVLCFIEMVVHGLDQVLVQSSSVDLDLRLLFVLDCMLNMLELPPLHLLLDSVGVLLLSFADFDSFSQSLFFLVT